MIGDSKTRKKVNMSGNALFLSYQHFNVEI